MPLLLWLQLSQMNVETPLNVDAASIMIGVSVVASELPVVVSVATKTLVTCDVDIVATVPTPEMWYVCGCCC